MPYKDLNLYWRAWIKREFKPRIERAIEKEKITKIELLNRAVDMWLKDRKY